MEIRDCPSCKTKPTSTYDIFKKIIRIFCENNHCKKQQMVQCYLGDYLINNKVKYILDRPILIEDPELFREYEIRLIRYWNSLPQEKADGD